MKLNPIASNMTEVQTEKGLVLFSYKTPVAAYWDNGQGGKSLFVTDCRWSRTTTRHINKWVMRGFHDMADVVEMDQSFFDGLV